MNWNEVNGTSSNPSLNSSSTTSEGGGLLLSATLIFSFSTIFMFLLHHRLGIRDVDGYAYIMGARSLHLGIGYQSLTGEEFNHWPPGYSLLLSPFPDILEAALILNYLSFGTTISLLYYLLRRLGWTWQAALGFSVTLGSGFFRLNANIVHADILTYALFLVAVYFVIEGRSRTTPGVIWALLVPVKLIAVIFLPPAVVADFLTGQRDWRSILRSYTPAAIATGVGVGGVLAFNALTTGTSAIAMHEKTSLNLLASSAKSFITSIPRGFLFNWHGPIMAPFPLIAFSVCTVLASICLYSLRPTPEGKWFRMYGAAFFVCAGLLLCVRYYDPSARLVGYGLIALMLGFRPMKWANKVWMLYGLASLMTGVVNGMTVNSLGMNDPRYADLVAQFRSYYVGSEIVATNSFHILDIHGNIASIPVADYAQTDSYHKFFWVTLPQIEGDGSVTEMSAPGKQWCEEKRFSGGSLFTRCGN